ncbi:MAG: hypothetical protein QGG25_08060, partial [Phycisphaerae bacterium]|nr:hypothetical protein [Phycisphaerae bacterium]
MKNELLRRTILAAAFLVVCSAMFTSSYAEAGTIIIPAWAFDRGNVKIDADPSGFADAGPVVIGGARKPWGWTLEYDV